MYVLMKWIYILNEVMQLVFPMVPTRAMDYLTEPQYQVWDTSVWDAGQGNLSDSPNNIGHSCCPCLPLKGWRQNLITEDIAHFRCRTWKVEDGLNPKLSWVLAFVVSPAVQAAKEGEKSTVLCSCYAHEPQRIPQQDSPNSVRVHFYFGRAGSCLVKLKSHSIGVQYWKLANYLGPVRSWVLEEKILWHFTRPAKFPTAF